MSLIPKLLPKVLPKEGLPPGLQVALGLVPPNFAGIDAYWKGKTNAYANVYPVGASSNAVPQVPGSALVADGTGYSYFTIPASELVGGFTIELDYWPESLSLDDGCRIFGTSGELSDGGVWSRGGEFWSFTTSNKGGFFKINENELSLAAVNTLKFEFLYNDGSLSTATYLNNVLKHSTPSTVSPYTPSDITIFGLDTAKQVSGSVTKARVWDSDGNLLADSRMINVGEDREFSASNAPYDLVHTGYTGVAVQEFTDGTGTDYCNEFGYGVTASGDRVPYDHTDAIEQYKPAPILEAVNKPCILGDESGKGERTGILTTSTITGLNGSPAPTCTVDGELTFANGTKYWAFEIYNGATLFGTYYCENGHPELYPGVLRIQDISGNDNHITLSGFTDEAFGTRDEAELITAQRAFDIDLEGPELITANLNTGDGITVSGDDATHIVTFSEDGLRFQADTSSPVLGLRFIDTSVVEGEIYRIRITGIDGSGALKSDRFGGNANPITANIDITTTCTASAAELVFYRKTAEVDQTFSTLSIKKVTPGITVADENGLNIYGNRAQYQPNTKAHADKLPAQFNLPDGPLWRQLVADLSLDESITLSDLAANTGDQLFNGLKYIAAYGTAQDAETVAKILTFVGAE